jgi:hypothetical protein
MSRSCRNGVLTVSLTVLAACAGASGGGPVPEDPFLTTPVSSLPVGVLAGQNALLLTVGAVLVGDSAHPLAELEPRRGALMSYANGALEAALRRDAREVGWQALAEQRRAARAAPTLALQPDNLPTAFLADRRVEAVPDPLRTQVRALAAVTNSRVAVVPAAVRVTASGEGYIASLLVAAVDTRVGSVLWRGRVTGEPAPSAEEAIASAAGRLVAPPAR